MSIDLALGIILAAVVVSAMAASASLDQSIKQLPRGGVSGSWRTPTTASQRTRITGSSGMCH